MRLEANLHLSLGIDSFHLRDYYSETRIPMNTDGATIQSDYDSEVDNDTSTRTPCSPTTFELAKLLNKHIRKFVDPVWKCIA